MKPARATAHANIALVKYWGKRAAAPGAPDDLNLPAVGSLSMTLSELRTETRVEPADRDRFELGGSAIEGPEADKVFRHLDRIWAEVGDGPRPRSEVRSVNHLPTAAGLASSASGFAALTLAGAAAYGLGLDRTALSTLARRGSGSAARSIWGGFVRQDRGERADGSDCVARPLHDATHWDLRLVIAATEIGRKPVGSTGGMERSRQHSPYYGAWVDGAEADLAAATRALADRDLPALGSVIEHSCTKMHACMLATRPPILYWTGATLEAVRALWRAREAGLRGWFTSDAGPHVKVFCAVDDAAAVAALLGGVAGVTDVRTVGPGPDARVEVAA